MSTIEQAKKYMQTYEATQGNDLNIGPAQAYATIAIAEQLESIATHLGNMHQTLIMPNAQREPIGIADILHAIYETLDERGK